MQSRPKLARRGPGSVPRPLTSVVAFGIAWALLSSLPGLAQSFSFSLKERLPILNDPISALALDPQGHWLAVASEDEVRILRFADGTLTPESRLEPPRKKIRGVAVSPDGEILAIADGTGRLFLYQSSSWRLAEVVDTGHKKGVTAVGFTVDGRYVLTGGEKGGVKAWTPKGELFAELTRTLEHDDEVLFVGGTGPGRKAISVGVDQQVILWDVDTQSPVRPTLVDMEVLSAALGGGGQVLALGLRELHGNLFASADLGNAQEIKADDAIRLLDLETGTRMRDLEGDKQDLDAVAVTPDGRFVAAAGSEAFAAVWDTETGRRVTRIPFQEPVTALSFSADGQWMLAGSRSGDVQALRLEGVGPAPARPQGGGAPIVIVVLQPESVVLDRAGARQAPVQVRSRSLSIRGRVKTTKPLASLQVNGQEITSLVTDASGDYLFNAFVPLPRAGRHEIRIVAENQAGTLQEESFQVRRADEVPLPDPTEGRRLALLVGISEYEDSSIDLEYADDDARALHDLLTSDTLGPGAFDPADVRLLVNEEATAAEINTGLRDFLQRATERDTVLFFFAGHGVPDPNRIQDLYLMAHDTDPNNVAGTGLLMRHVREAIAQIPARDVLILTDACHSAGMGAPKSFRSARTNPIHAEFLDKMRHSSGGLAILTASEAAQASLETAERGHGLFTYHLLRGLQGRADDDDDAIVSLGEIMEYVREKVKDETKGRQVPAIGPTSFDRHLPLVVVEDPP